MPEVETVPAILEAAHDSFEVDETSWLLKASAKAISQVAQGDMLGERLGELADQFQASDNSEQLIAEASGIVALVGLYHVRQGTVRARDILEGAPALIIDTALQDSEPSATFSARLADATEEFCIGLGIPDEDEKVDTAFGIEERMSLNQLADLAKQGDGLATNALLAKSEKWARAIAINNGYYLVGGELEDMCQEAMMSVIRALKIYDLTRGNFANLAEMAIKRGIWTAIKTATRQKHTPLNNARSLNERVHGNSSVLPFELEDVIPSQRLSIEEQVINREFLTEELVPQMHKLSELEHTSLMLFMQGYSYDEIGDYMDETPKAIDNALQRARSKLKPLISSKYN